MTTLQFKRGTAARWTLVNPVLAAGEPGFETDTGKEKLGDGTTAWVALPYQGATVPTPDASATVKGLVQLAGALGGTAAAPTVAYSAVTGRPTLGGAAALSVGTGAGTVAAGDDARITGAAQAMTTTAVKTGAYTAGVNEIVPCDSTTAGFIVTLPTAPVDKTRVIVKKIDLGANAVTIACGGSDVLNRTGGATTLVLSLPGQAATLQYAATGGLWYVTADDLPLPQLDTRYAATPPLRTVTADTTIAVGDANGTVVVNSATTRAVTIAADVTANLPVGCVVRIVNIGAAVANVIDGTGGGTTVSFTLAQYDTARMLKVAASTWVRA